MDEARARFDAFRAAVEAMMPLDATSRIRLLAGLVRHFAITPSEVLAALDSGECRTAVHALAATNVSGTIKT